MHISRVGVLSIVVGLLAASQQIAQASVTVIQEQSQEVSSSSNASVTCTGDCNGSANAESSATGRQWQRTEITSGRNVVSRSYRTSTRRIATAYIGWQSDGSVRLNWGMRGGTCHVRYTEAAESVYKYATAAGCDDGGVTIGGLTPGVRYRFQVRQNDGAWSRPVVIKVL